MTEPVKILIVGNGFGGIYALKNLHKIFCGNPNVKISIVGTTDYFLFTPLLHEVATGSVRPTNIIEPIQKVLRCCIEDFHLGKAKNIDLGAKTIEVAGKEISYDFLVLAPGAETNFYNIPGAQEFSLTLKSLEDAKAIKNRCIEILKSSSLIEDKLERKKALSFTVIGGGPTGVELVAELQEFLMQTFPHYCPKEVIKYISVTLIQRDVDLLPQFSKKLRDKSLEALRHTGVQVLLGTEVKEVREKEIILNTGVIDSNTTIWVAGIKPVEMSWQNKTPEQKGGKLVVNEYLQLKNNPEVFALGDSAYLEDKKTGMPVPALAQAAVKEAQVVAKNIQLSMENKTLQAFEYKSSGNLVSVGQWMAVGEIFGFSFSGHFAWWVWRTVYLFKLLSFSKKLKVAKDWTINLFLPRDISPL